MLWEGSGCEGSAGSCEAFRGDGHQVGGHESGGHEGQHRAQRRQLQRAQATNAVAGRAAIAQTRTVADQKAAHQQLPSGHAGVLRLAARQREPPNQRPQHHAQRVNQPPVAGADKARLLEKRPFGHERPTAGKDGTHAADPAVEQIQQRHASANGEAAQQVVLPAEGEEGVDEGHGEGLSGTRIGLILRTSSLKALGFRGAFNFFILLGSDSWNGS